MKERTVFFKHGLRNAMISVITLSSLIVTWLITGTIFVENIFSYPGMGQYVFTALIAQDYPWNTRHDDSFCDHHHFIKSHG